MKAPAFWYRPFGLCAALLMPFGRVYEMAAEIRRAFARPYRAAIPVICVGNVVAGGAGKTPTALALARLLQQTGAQPVFVTRGYGGMEAGPLRVDPDRHSARDVGDEALLLACAAPCWIGRDRAAAIRAAAPQATHIILDDGLQNPTIAPSVKLCVIDGATGLGNGAIIPAGPLREDFIEATKRLDAVIVIGALARPLPFARKIPVLQAQLTSALSDDFPRDGAFLAFAGIGRPAKFYASCREAGLALAVTKDFPDHHLFTPPELAALAEQAKAQNLRLITTAKDWVRLPDAFRAQVAVLPVTLTFEDEAALKRVIRTA